MRDAFGWLFSFGLAFLFLASFTRPSEGAGMELAFFAIAILGALTLVFKIGVPFLFRLIVPKRGPRDRPSA